MNLIQILGAIEIGLIYSIIALGVFLTFRVVNFADLTVDGSFPLGAAITAIIVTKNYGIILGLTTSMIAGMLAGLVTSLLSSKFKIMDLLAGILVMTALYSINLRIMGQPNIALFEYKNWLNSDYNLIVLSLLVIIIFIIFTLLFKTEFGLSLRATGINPKCAQAQGINLGFYQAVSLSLSNGIIALAGGLFAIMQGFADISMGTGTVVIGLASLIIGEKLMPRNFFLLIWSCILGSIVYRIAITMALNADFLGLESSDLNLITSVIVISFLIIPKLINSKFKGVKI